MRDLSPLKLPLLLVDAKKELVFGEDGGNKDRGTIQRIINSLLL